MKSILLIVQEVNIFQLKMQVLKVNIQKIIPLSFLKFNMTIQLQKNLIFMVFYKVLNKQNKLNKLNKLNKVNKN